MLLIHDTIMCLFVCVQCERRIRRDTDTTQCNAIRFYTYQDVSYVILVSNLLLRESWGIAHNLANNIKLITTKINVSE